MRRSLLVLGFSAIAIVAACQKRSAADDARIDSLKMEAGRLIRETAELRRQIADSDAKGRALLAETRYLRDNWFACMSEHRGGSPVPQVSETTAAPTWPRGGFSGNGVSSSAPVSSTSTEPPSTGPKVIIIGDSSPPSDIAANEAVGAKCRQEWGTNYEMVKYCSQKQADAKGRLMSRNASNSNVPLDVFDGIRSSCRSEWPSDYNMQDYCETKQLTAYADLHR
jgi:hypothetical protein